MASRMLHRYGLEDIARVLVAVGFLLILSAWIVGFYYFGITGKTTTSFIVPFIFTCVLVLLLLIIKYRYTLFERYPYLMNLPSLFYRIKDKKGSNKNQSIAFSMIFTVHALVIAFLGLLSLVLAFVVGSSTQRGGGASPFLYLYLVIIGVLAMSVLLQYRRIYRKFMN